MSMSSNPHRSHASCVAEPLQFVWGGAVLANYLLNPLICQYLTSDETFSQDSNSFHLS